jgi:hypothetical protein
LRIIVVALIHQFSHKSMYLRSIAQAQVCRRNLDCTPVDGISQLIAIANKRGLTTSQLANPYLKELAPVVISQIVSQPDFFHETRRLFHSNENAFVTKSLPYILPHLFVTRNRPALDRIVSIKKQYMYEIAKDFIHDILAACYLLADENDIDNAINFTLQVLSSDMGEELQIEGMLGIYLQSVLISLVIIAGEADQQRQGAVSGCFLVVFASQVRS